MSVLNYEIALSKAKGKIRLKERFAFNNYGIPVPPTKTIITPKHYLEWQIGYDKIVNNNNEVAHFIGANNKRKHIYELSEILYFGVNNSLISMDKINSLKGIIQNNTTLIDERENINRTDFVQAKIGNINFLKSNVCYPLLVYKFDNRDILCEIVVREKQYAVGTMPMLYFCMAMSCIYDANGDRSFLNRTINSKEKGYLRIDNTNISIFIKIFEIFGMLSKAHKHDCLAILDYILINSNCH